MRGKKKGFTLVELIVVIAIVAIIAAVAVPATIKYVSDAKKSMAENETLNVINTITESMAIIATKQDGMVTKQGMLDILGEQMPYCEYVTKVVVEKDGEDQFKVTVHASDIASKMATFPYSSFEVQWGEADVSSFSFIPSDTGSGWAVE